MFTTLKKVWKSSFFLEFLGHSHSAHLHSLVHRLILTVHLFLAVTETFQQFPSKPFQSHLILEIVI